jgi:hypothetical protein
MGTHALSSTHVLLHGALRSLVKMAQQALQLLQEHLPCSWAWRRALLLLSAVCCLLCAGWLL